MHVFRDAPISNTPLYPPTLIVSESPFCLDNGFGVTMSTFFSKWDSDNLFTLYASECAEPATDICKQNLFVDVIGHYGFRYLFPFYLGKTASWRGLFSFPWLTKNMDDFYPQVVYSMVFRKETLAYADWAASHFNCPHVMHLADATSPENLSPALRESYKEICARAAERIVISEEMKASWESYFAMPFHVLHNGAAAQLFGAHRDRSTAEDVFTIRYVGSIVPRHHFNAFEDLVAAVKEFKAQVGPIKLEIYGGDWTAKNVTAFIDNETITYGGRISNEENFSLLKSADLLIVPISFEEKELEVNKLSFPTKLPEYLASGSPVLVYGPESCAPVQFCLRNKLGFVQSKRSVDELVKQITSIRNNRRQVLAKAACDAQFIEQNYSAAKMRQKFESIIRGAVKKYNVQISEQFA